VMLLGVVGAIGGVLQMMYKEEERRIDVTIFIHYLTYF
jgi:hypothetical protein